MASDGLARTLRLATAGAKPRLSAKARAALLTCTDFVGLAELATAHRVAPWLAAAVASEPAVTALPGAAFIRQAGGSQVMRTLGLFAELTQVVRMLNRLEIPVVVLKGPDVAQRFYPESGLRPYSDIDILIHESDLAQVMALLKDRGYEDKNEADDPDPHRLHDCHGIFQRIFMNHTTGHIVEVHCDHLQIGLEPVSMDKIWTRSSEAKFASASANVLEPHDLFVQLCVHLNRHGYERLVWFKDIDLLVRGGTMDWEQVTAKAEEQGCLGAVSYTLMLLPKVLGTPMPEGAVRLSTAQGRASRLLYQRMWPAKRVLRLEPQRQWRFRRLVQFAPETGFIRGGLPSFLTTGRRRDKLRVMLAGARNGAGH